MKVVLAVLLVFIAIRFILFIIYSPNLKSGESISFHTILFDDPKETSRYNRLTANYKNFYGSQKIIVTYSPTLKLNYGDEIIISGKVDNRVINTKNSILTIYFPKIERVKNQQNFILAIANDIRQRVKLFYFKTLSKPDANLLLGIVLGIKGDFSKQFYSYLQSSGMLHVIAASGMNITLTAGFIFAICAKLFKRQIAIFITILSIFAYLLLSGFSASIVRAGLMGVFANLAGLLGRQYSALYGLFFIGSLMLLSNPSLFQDAGFQLSMMSTFGILILKPLLPLKHAAFDDFSTTISAQIFTLPILLSTFGTYGLMSILVNVLVLWTIPILMIIGGLGAVIGVVFGPLGILLMYLTIPFLWFFTMVVTYFGKLRLNLQIKEIPLVMILGYYLLLVGSIWFVKKRNLSTT